MDQALFTYFPKPFSFTGEDVLEITCHGGRQTPKRILRALLRAGLRPAEPGEFSLRAFYNGKLDLIQAEGLLRLIESRSEKAASCALSHLQGRLSKVLDKMEKDWLDLLSHIEADIDFSLEGLSTLSEKKNRTADGGFAAADAVAFKPRRFMGELEQKRLRRFFRPFQQRKNPPFSTVFLEKKKPLSPMKRAPPEIF